MRFLLIGLFCVLNGWGFAQPPESFYRRIGGSGKEVGYSVKEIYNRQYVVAGSTTSFGAGAADVYLFLADSMGQVLWEKTYGTAGVESGRSVVFNNADSGFVVAGYGVTNSSGYDMLLIRTSKTGEVVWQVYVGSEGWDFANDLIILNDSTVIICGETTGSGGYTNGLLASIDLQSGKIRWQKELGGPFDDDFVALHKLPGDEVVIAGNMKSNDLIGDFWIYKINANGDSLNSATFGTKSFDEGCHDLFVDSDQNLILCGYRDVDSTSVLISRALALKIDTIFSFIGEHMETNAWDQDVFYAGADSKLLNRYCFSRHVHYVTGADVQPILYDHSFGYLDATTYGDAGTDKVYSVESTQDGFVMVGFMEQYDGNNTDILLIKFGSDVQNVPLITSSKSKRFEAYQSALYASGNKIYFSSVSTKPVKYKIMSIDGKPVQNGIGLSPIELDANISSGLYLIWLFNEEDKPTILKFIKYD